MAAVTFELGNQFRKSLLAEARRGNREAFADLILPYARALYRRARRLTGNHADAEEILQESLLKALSRLDQFSGGAGDGESDFRAWVARIVANAAIDCIRRRRKRILPLDEPIGTSGVPFAEQVASEADNPEERLARRELRRLCADAIERLDPDLRVVCLLRDVLHQSTQEVAERLGLSMVAVRLRLFRGRRQLRERLRLVLQRSDGAAIAKPGPNRVFSAANTLPSCACGD